MAEILACICLLIVVTRVPDKIGCIAEILALQKRSVVEIAFKDVLVLAFRLTETDFGDDGKQSARNQQ